MKRMQTTKHVTAARRGFSLIELLIVLAILVLLASLVAPRLLGSRDQAKIDTTKTQIGMLKGGLEMYSLGMSGFPTTEQGLQALVERPSADSGDAGTDDEFGTEEDLADFDLDEDADSLDEEDSGLDSNWKGPYIKAEKIPKDPWAPRIVTSFLDRTTRSVNRISGHWVRIARTTPRTILLAGAANAGMGKAAMPKDSTQQKTMLTARKSIWAMSSQGRAGDVSPPIVFSYGDRISKFPPAARRAILTTELRGRSTAAGRPLIPFN